MLGVPIRLHRFEHLIRDGDDKVHPPCSTEALTAVVWPGKVGGATDGAPATNRRTARDRAAHERTVGWLRSPWPPTATGVPTWPAYTLKDCSTMWLDAECKIVNDPDKAERLFWNDRA
jgi:carboxylesterase type B